MDDAQAERSGYGGINAGPLFAQNIKAQRRAAGHIRHHRTLIIHLRTEDTKIRKGSVLLGEKNLLEFFLIFTYFIFHHPKRISSTQ